MLGRRKGTRKQIRQTESKQRDDRPKNNSIDHVENAPKPERQRKSLV